MLSSRTMSAPPCERLRELLDVRHLDLDAHGVRRGRARAASTTSPTSVEAARARRGDVVVLDQHARRQVEAVVRAAARAHRVALERAQPGRRLARVEDARAACPATASTNSRVERRDAGDALQEVQRDPLRTTASTRAAPRPPPARSPAETRCAVRDERVERDGVVERASSPPRRQAARRARPRPWR